MIEFDLYEIIRESHRYERDDMHTCMPGRVTAYDPTTQLADIQLLLKLPTFDADGNRIEGTSYPVLPKVPVVWPRGSGFMDVLPFGQGDNVLVFFSEGGTGEWRNTGEESEPFDVSRHQITYPFAIPGALPDSEALTDASVTSGSRAVWGQSGGPQIQNDGSHISFTSSGSTADPGDAPALASKTDSNFQEIITAIQAAATAATGGGSAPVTGTVLGTILNNLAAALSFAATKSALVKCK
jgi:hypothetical protein